MADDPAALGGPARSEGAHIRTFLIADVRGYTVFTQERGDEAAALLASKFAEVARQGVEARGGTVVELRGDEALAVFDSARQAIRASIDLQRRFVDETVADPALPLAVGIGLDAGEAVAVGDGFRGGALNLAARLCSIAGPGEILASPAVTHLARKVDGVAYVDRGPVALKGLADPVQVIRLRAEAEDAAEDGAFRRALGSAGVRLAPAVPGAIVPNPYKGLRAFEEADAADFFGREDLVELLVEHLAGTRFLAVVGPSGSGKSSVVRAGLVPALRRGAIPGSEGWPIVDMFPGPKPLDGLEAALLRTRPDAPPAIMDQLERDEGGLHRAVLRLLPPDRSELVLVMDQFEEVFTLVEDEAVRTHFLASIEAAVTDPHSRLRVVVTLRGDFYDRPLLYRGFAELFKSRVEAVVPLSPEELERAISEPAKRVDVTLEPRLIAAMLADVAEEPGGLPLMEYALTELFDRRDGRVLTLDAYRDVGGVRGALGRRAEELFADLDDDGKEAARQLFLRLVTLGEGTEDTRRRAPRAEVDSLDVDQASLTSILDAYGAARLLSFDRDPRTGEPTVELAHEALLTAWPRLNRWIDAARDDLRTERRLAASARDWVEADRDSSFLLAGSRLEQAEAWEAGSGLAVTPEERQYLEASRAERERRRADEEARAAHERELERRSVRRLRAVVAVLAAAALIAAGLTVFARNQAGRAEREERNATARELAAASVANLEVDPERSILLALEAIEATRSVDGDVLPEAEGALHAAVTASRIQLTVSGVGGQVDWSPQGVFVTEGPENTGLIDIRDAATGETVRRWTGHDPENNDINDVRFSPDGSMLATAGDDGTLQVWDPSKGESLASVGGTGTVLGPSFDADGSLVAASWPDQSKVEIADPMTGRVVRTIGGLNRFPADTALSPDGGRVAVAMGDIDVVQVFDVDSGDLVFGLPGHNYSVFSVSWSPDGRRIATGSGDSGVRIWDGGTGKLEARLLGHTGIVATVDWAPDSSRLASAGSDGTARVWEIAEQLGAVDGRELFSLQAQQEQSGTFAAFAPDGEHLITGDLGITAIKIWDLSLGGDAEVVNVPTDYLSPADVASLPGGRLVASHGNGKVSLWRMDGTHVATIGPGGGPQTPVRYIAATADGSRIAMTPNFSGYVSAWDAATGDRVFETVVLPHGEVTGLDWSSDARHLAVAGFDGSLSVLDASGKKVQYLHEPNRHVVEAVAFGPDGRSIALAVDNNRRPTEAYVSIWDWERGEVDRKIDVVGATALAFRPDGATLAIGRFDGTVQLHDPTTGELLRRFSAHAGPVNVVTFSPDGERVATGGEDGSVGLFDARTGERQLLLPGHDILVSGLAFTRDGRRLASASPDGIVRVWALDLDELIRIARSEVERKLTDDECRQYLHQPQGCA